MKKTNQFQKLKRNLQNRHARLNRQFEEKHLKAFKWLAARNLALPDIYGKTTRLLTTGSLAGTLLLSGSIQPSQNLPLKQVELNSLKAQLTQEEFSKQLKSELLPLLPENIGKLNEQKSVEISNVLKKYFGFPVCFRYQGNELNYHYAWTGYEQHLYRYPGDTLDQHDEMRIAGIAPGLGAWGYFTDSKESMTNEEYMMEKYYVAVQTLYLPEWQSDWQRIYDWYKYRKMVMINPENGTACVVVVGDAGPAQWTGKQFGGSPEVMKTLDLHEGYHKGKVILAFVDDPENKVPLGPVEALPSAELAEK